MQSVYNQPNISSNNFNPNLRRPPYTIVTYGEHNYRVLTKQYQGGLSMLKTWTVFWLAMLIIALTITIVDLLNFNRTYILFSGCVSSLIFTIAVFINRNQLKKIIFSSSLNLSIFVLLATLIAFLQVPWMTIPATTYILAEFIISSVLMKNKGHILGKCIVLVQILVISLKVDGKIDASWIYVLFGFIIFMSFILISLIFVGIYLIYAFCNKREQVYYEYKFQGTVFLFLSLFSFLISLSLPLINQILDTPTWIFSLSFSIMYIIMPIYIYLKLKQIVVIFCTLNEVKAFNQIIQIQKIADGIDLQNTQTTSKATRSKSYCYRLSSNWFSFQPQPSAKIENKQHVQNPQLQKDQIPKCLICLQEKAQLIWMPCGHLTVCMQCCQFMFDKKNINCVLCKKVPQQLFLIDNKIKKGETAPQNQKIIDHADSQTKIKQDQAVKIQYSNNQSMKQIIQMDIEIQLRENESNLDKNENSLRQAAKTQPISELQQQLKRQEGHKRSSQFDFKDQKSKSIRNNNFYQILQGFNVKVI